MPLAFKLDSALEVRYPKMLFFHHHVVGALRFKMTSCPFPNQRSVRIFRIIQDQQSFVFLVHCLSSLEFVLKERRGWKLNHRRQ